MTWFTGTVAFVLIWWTTLFAVLPLWTRPQADADPDTGGWRGAPERPLILRKLLVTTLVSALIWAGVWSVVASDWLDLRTGWLALPER